MTPSTAHNPRSATEPWTFEGPIATTTGPGSTLVEETTFCMSAPNGDILPGAAHGLFFLDRRFLSCLRLRLDGHGTEHLGVASEAPFGATYLVRPTGSDVTDTTVAVFRRRRIGRGLVEHVEVRNHGTEPRTVVVEVDADADFADLFAVKEQRVVDRLERHVEVRERSVTWREAPDAGASTTLSTPVPPDGVSATGLRWRLDLPAGGAEELCFEVHGSVDGVVVEPRFDCRGHARPEPVERLHAWRAASPSLVAADPRLGRALRRTSADLGSLRLVDPDHPDDVIIAAGAPWFMTLFGRDALLTAYMALLVDPGIALGVLRTLARLQGTDTDPETEEQPGRILHEVRFHDRPSWSLRDGTIYYGTADATPLFVVLLGELRRWGLAREIVDELLPAADRALEWVVTLGDRDGDGYVEYERSTEQGLRNQGWKDSWDAIRFADGRLAEGPIALAEVQGYVYAAYLARAHFADERGDHEGRARWRDRAERLRLQFHRDFWLEDRGYLALALDGDKRPIDSLCSNMGHCLWSGIVDPSVARSVADHLVSPELFSGWGVRTMASSMAAYNPVSYHLGSVWPHDTAICIAGLLRYGFVEHAHRIADGLLDVADAFDGRLPELLAGVDRSELAEPAVYPTSCLPQAWAAAAPLLLVRSLLRFDPWMPHRRLWVAPALPSWCATMQLGNVPLDGTRVSIEAERDHAKVRVDGLADDVVLERSARHPLTAAVRDWH